MVFRMVWHTIWAQQVGARGPGVGCAFPQPVTQGLQRPSRLRAAPNTEVTRASYSARLSPVGPLPSRVKPATTAPTLLMVPSTYRWSFLNPVRPGLSHTCPWGRGLPAGGPCQPRDRSKRSRRFKPLSAEGGASFLGPDSCRRTHARPACSHGSPLRVPILPPLPAFPGGKGHLGRGWGLRCTTAGLQVTQNSGQFLQHSPGSKQQPQPAPGTRT